MYSDSNTLGVRAANSPAPPCGSCAPTRENEQEGEPLDLIWLDFGIGVGGRLDEFLNAWWPRLRDGGLLVVHSTLTNAVTRHWLEKMRSRIAGGTPGDSGGGDSAGVGGDVHGNDPSEDEAAEPGAHSHQPRDVMGADFRELSFLEPHKMYQNSCSIFQKRTLEGEGYAEPVLTSYP